MPPAPRPASSRFWPKVQIGDPSSCWPWTGARTSDGYGTFERTTAHRVAFELSGGVIPDGCVVMHTCDNRPCCNPAHLRAGSQKENLADMRAKGRMGDCRVLGEAHGRCKVSDAQVAEIRVLYQAGGLSQQAIGRRYGISQEHVSHLVRGANRRAA